MKTDRFKQQILDTLKAAGWHERRCCNSFALKSKEQLKASGFAVYDAALDVLKEFGELIIGESGPGQFAARTQISIEPQRALKFYTEDFLEYELVLKTLLCPIGVASDDTALGIDSEGRVYLLGNWIWLLGESFDEALETCIIGKLGRELNMDGTYV